MISTFHEFSPAAAPLTIFPMQASSSQTVGDETVMGDSILTFLLFSIIINSIVNITDA